MQEEEYGLYSKVTFRPIERLALIAGGRFSWYRGDFYTTTLSSGASTNDSKRVDGNFTPYGGLVYDSGDSPERDEKLRGTVADLLWSLDYDVEAEVQSFLATTPR